MTSSIQWSVNHWCLYRYLFSFPVCLSLQEYELHVPQIPIILDQFPPGSPRCLYIRGITHFFSFWNLDWPLKYMAKMESCAPRSILALFFASLVLDFSHPYKCSEKRLIFMLSLLLCVGLWPNHFGGVPCLAPLFFILAVGRRHHEEPHWTMWVIRGCSAFLALWSYHNSLGLLLFRLRKIKFLICISYSYLGSSLQQSHSILDNLDS